MGEGRISDGRNNRADDHSRFSVNPFVKISLSKAPRHRTRFSIRTVAMSYHNTEKHPDFGSLFRGRRLACSGGLTTPRASESPVLGTDPGALAAPGKRGKG